ncbi:hypothetical protein ACFYOG_35875 [Streptomyces sp. NPDC007818]|uniref:hypothetical protein n=1 Tax=Streptomyces sp. NPDC007818 TaxID=3364780 RepID=UPI0036B549A1
MDLTPIPSDLTTLYWLISEASLPDVGNGYFLHSPATVAEHFREYGPASIAGESIALVFAGDGGGHLFAIGDSGQVWKSTTASWSPRPACRSSSNGSADRSQTSPDPQPRNKPAPAPRRSCHSRLGKSRAVVGSPLSRGRPDFKERHQRNRVELIDRRHLKALLLQHLGIDALIGLPKVPPTWRARDLS